MNREQERRLDNVLRFGRILEVDYQNTTARVQAMCEFGRPRK